MRVLVCGGRDFTDRGWLFDVLDWHHKTSSRITLVIHGAQDGADSLAGQWARLNGVEELPFPAKWKLLGGHAGAVRNTRMLVEGRPDYVIAFPGGRGTRNMIAQATERSIGLFEVAWKVGWEAKTLAGLRGVAFTSSVSA